MDDLFSISVHHGGYFTENPKTYVGGEVDIVDNCDLDKWSKVEIEGICKDFGYASVSRLWYTIPGMDQERANFHLVVDDHDAMYMTELVKGHEEIHVYVEHPIDDPILVDEGKNDQTFNADVAASQVGLRRVGKEPIIEHPPQVFIISDDSDSGGGGSGLDDEVELNHGVRDFVEDSSDSWDDKDDDDDVVKPSQMGAGVMNSDYKSEELHSLVESSSDDELGSNSDDDAMPNVHIASSSTNMSYYQTRRDHDNAPSDFAGKDSHFFKNILDETLCDQKLMIPKTFIKKYGENLSNRTFLKLPNGAKWKVELTYHKGEVWLQKGWKKFAECCSLKRGHLLVFRLEDNSHLHTLIFDESGIEINYPSNRPNSNEQGKVDEECESESSDQILSDSPEHPKTRRSHKRKREGSTGKSKAEAVKNASGFKSKNPYFKMVMTPSSIKAYYMSVPVPFVEEMYIQNGQEVKLKVGDQSWEVWFSIPKNCRHGSISRGWSKFASENNLQVGDVCIFELIKRDNVVLKVFIFRV